MFTERDERLARPRALLTTRACWWAIGQIRREHARVAGVARQLGTTWRTVWRSIEPLLEVMAADPARFEDVSSLGVDEHIWHHVSTKLTEAGGRGPKEFTGMVDLTRNQHGRVRARLLDLVPGRSGKVCADWLAERGEAFRRKVEVATLDPFHGYKNAIDDKLADATAVLDAFHVVKLGTDAVDQCRRRVQQETLGHRGRKGDPLYGIRNLLRAGAEKLTDRQWTRLATAVDASEAHLQVYLAWSCAQHLRAAYRHPNPAEGIRIAERVVASFPSCPVPEVARLGRTLEQWRSAFLAYFTSDRSSNGGTKAINSLIELHRRVARGLPQPRQLPAPHAPHRRRTHQPPPQVGRAANLEYMRSAQRRGLAVRLCEAPVGAELPDLAQMVFAGVAQDVAFDFACFATTDPATGLITWASKTRSLGVGDEEFAAAEYGPADINSFVEIARRRPPVGALSVDTGGRPDTCRRHREFMHPRFGFADELRVVFVSRDASWGALALYRSEGQPPFTAADAAQLGSVSHLVADAIQRSLFRLAPAAHQPPADAVTAGPAVLIIDSTNHVTHLTPGARSAVEDLGGWEHGSLPSPVLAVAASTRSRYEHCDTRTQGRSGRWLSIRAARLTGPADRSDVVVTIEPTPRTAMTRLTFAAHGLTAREEDVAALVLQGASTHKIATALHLSPYTVQDHLKTIFIKLGVTSRRDMTARLVLE